MTQSTRERALEAALRRILKKIDDNSGSATFTAAEHDRYSAALALPPSPQPAPVASGDWEIMGDGPEPFVGKPGIFGAEVRAALAPSRPVSHAELMQYARLIAAAPDMLAALDCLKDTLESHARADMQPKPSILAGMHAICRAAIARATGREG